MLNEKDLITKYRDIIYQETGRWIMPLTPINRNKSNRSVQLVLSANRNLAAYGRTMSADLMDVLMSLPESELVKECQNIMNAVITASQTKEFQNAAVFYPDFPNQVMEMSELEHYIYQLGEYLGVSVAGVSFRPEFEATDRTPLIEDFKRDLKVIDVADSLAVHNLMHNRMMSTATLSKPKMETLLNYMHDTSKWYSWIHEQAIPNRENKAAIAFDIVRNENISNKAQNEMLHSLLTDATDVLRLAAELSNGKMRTLKQKEWVAVWDKNKGESINNPRHEWRTYRVQKLIENTPGLTGKVYFKLSRHEAKLVNDLLNDAHDLYTAVWLRKDLFKTFSRSIHAGSDFPRLQKAYNNLYTNQKITEAGIPIVSPYAAIQKALNAVRNGEEGAIDLTKKAAHDFPGVFNRNFIQFAIAGINHGQLQQICDIYAEHAYKTPIREQLKLYNLVDLYKKGLEYRAIHIAKLGRFVKEDSTYSFTNEQALMIKKGIIDSVAKQLQNHNDLGNIYIDPNVENIMLPENGERTASKGSALPSGSIIKGNKDCNIIRQFVGWENQNENRIDIDTSVAFYDKDMDKVAECSYYEHKAWKDDELLAVHSGDIADAPVFSAEFIDIDKQKCVEAGVKYISLSVYCYNEIPFDKLDVAKFGFMQRQGTLDMDCNLNEWNQFNGQLFEPETVEALIDLNSATTSTVPLIYDVEKDEFIWVDKPLKQERGLQNNQNTTYMNATKALIHRYTNNYSPTLGDLVQSYVYAGKAAEVPEPSQADVIFTMSPNAYTEDKELSLKQDAKIVSVNDFDYIASELMTVKEADTLQKDDDMVQESMADDLILESDEMDDPGDMSK